MEGQVVNNRRIRIDDYNTARASLQPVQEGLLDALFGNDSGSDAFNQAVTDLGEASRADHLILPTTFTIPDVGACEVGRKDAHELVTREDCAHIYVLNKAAAPYESEAVKFALLRLEAVRAGWLTKGMTSHIIRERAPSAAESMAIFTSDMSTGHRHVIAARQAAHFIPLIAEYIFRTRGHNYATYDAGRYVKMFKTVLTTCLMPGLSKYITPVVLYRTVLHWVPPARVWEVLQAQKDGEGFSNAIKSRANKPPAGTALVIITAVVLSAMESTNMLDKFERQGGFKLQALRAMAVLMKQNPTRYHKDRYAYGLPPLSTEEVAEIEAIKETAVRFAPYAQAFINVYLKHTHLGRTQILKKYADRNSRQMRLASHLFRSSTAYGRALAL